MVEEKENRIRAETETENVAIIKAHAAEITEKELKAYTVDIAGMYAELGQKSAKHQAILDEAWEAHRPKTGLEKYEKLRDMANWTSYLLNGVSVATGFSLVYFTAVDSLPQFLPETVTKGVAAGLSIVGLLVIEIGKRETASLLFDPYFREKKFHKTSVFPALGLAVFMAGSIFLSVKGAAVAVSKMSSKVSEAAAVSQTRADSVAVFWDTEIAAADTLAAQAKKAADGYMAANMVFENGEKVFSANSNVKKTYAKMQSATVDAVAKVSVLRERKLAALEKEGGKAEKEGEKAKDEIVSESSSMMYFAGTNELGCVAALVFLAFFKAMVYLESLPNRLAQMRAKAGEKKNGATGEPVGDPLPVNEQDLTTKPTMTVWANPTTT